MKKLTLLIASFIYLISVNSQTVTYDFSQDPLSNGWTSVIDPGSGSGITYDASGQQIGFNITTGVQKNFIHRSLPYELKDQFCASFKIRPMANNQNSFFPLIFTPNSLVGSNNHPWRMNTPDMSSAGAIQNLDLLGVFITHMEIKFINRNDNVVNSNSIMSFTQPFYMTSNTDYWVKLEVVSATSTRLIVYSDATMMTELRNQLFTTPDLDPFNEIYIANCNGNSGTSIYGKLDDYVINHCSVATVQEIHSTIDEWNLFPNPSSSIFELNGDKNIDNIIIYDLKGAKISCEILINKNTASFAIENENGVYIIEIFAEDGSIQRKRALVQKINY